MARRCCWARNIFNFKNDGNFTWQVKHYIWPNMSLIDYRHIKLGRRDARFPKYCAELISHFSLNAHSMPPNIRVRRDSLRIFNRFWANLYLQEITSMLQETRRSDHEQSHSSNFLHFFYQLRMRPFRLSSFLSPPVFLCISCYKSHINLQARGFSNCL